MSTAISPSHLRPSVRRLYRGVLRVRRILVGVGHGLVGFAVPVLWHALVDVLLRLRHRQVVAKQVSDNVVGVGGFVVGGGMVFVVFALAFFAGTEVGLQGYTGLAEIGAESFMGIAGSLANVREIVPVIAGAAIAAQIGTAYTAELGAMRVSDEIDAMETMGLPTLTYLASTRVVSTLLAIVPLYLVALFASFFATRLVTVQGFGLSSGVYDYYFSLYLPPIDILYSLIKVVVFSVIIVLIHCYHGYYASGGPVGVGRAVGRAVRTSIVSLVIVNLLLSYLFWGQGSAVTVTG
jgi:phospholipid/cholesterol/gamma-HCH transport system permease protein